MRIGIDARMYGKAQSGIGNYIKQLTDHIFTLDKENDYYLFLLEPVFSEYQPTHPNVHKIKVTSHWYSLAEQTTFLWEINKYKLDLMHFPHFNAPIFYNRPRIVTIHDIIPKFFPGHKQKSWLRKLAYELVIKTNLRKSVKIIASSEHTKQDLIRYFSLKPEKIEVVHLGIESHFQNSKNYDKIKGLKDQYQITKPFIFFLSVWRNHKNFEGLISAFEILKNKGNFEYQLVLGGQEDPHYQNIRQKIEHSVFKNDIITPGFISDDDLPLFYNAADLVAIPSFYEGFGLIGLEAMACGTPVVSSNTTSLPEINGDAALYFEPKNIEQMAKVISSVLTNPELKAQLVAKGYQRIIKFSWNECAQRTLNLYRNILNNK
ncbi:MAG: glycosyltransferase family 1 protein [Candidatus Parcubacteria bacterium]|nr:glycosyltransferase family 1 protein [Candidatus Parcubacteria bacterium]